MSVAEALGLLYELDVRHLPVVRGRELVGIISDRDFRAFTGVDEDEARSYLYRGIATRSFERRFNLADHVKVVSASLENGLLHIDLEREIPEAMKPRTIKIGKSKSRLLDVKKDSKKKNEAA